MFRKLIIVAGMCCTTSVFADGGNSTPPHLNNPAVGSRQSSEQIFGEPKVQGTAGEKYYTPKQLKSGRSRPTQGSVTPSNQTFGDPKINGTKGAKYYSKDQLINSVNRSTQGSVTSSQQRFEADVEEQNSNKAP